MLQHAYCIKGRSEEFVFFKPQRRLFTSFFMFHVFSAPFTSYFCYIFKFWELIYLITIVAINPNSGISFRVMKALFLLKRSIWTNCWNDILFLHGNFTYGRPKKRYFKCLLRLLLILCGTVWRDMNYSYCF